MSKCKRKVSNRNKPKKNVNTENPDESNKIYIDFTQYSKWTDTVSISGFTNNLKDVEEAFRHFCFILKQLLGDIEVNGMGILANNVRHCHKLTGKNRELAIKVIRKIHGDGILDDDTSLWQLAGKTEEIRIVGTFVAKTFYPLFIDHHHLIHPDRGYNQRDYNHYSYKPQQHLHK